MANTIEVILKSKDEATPGIKAFGLSLTDLKSGIQMAGQAIQKTAQAIKEVWDFTKEGAAVIQTTQSFDRLGLSIQTLRDASLGTVDDMTLMKASLTLTAGASEELQGRLLGSAGQLMEIAKAANALNPTLGDTAYMYESIATGIKRASPMILDNLGIVVKIDEANRAYAASIGKTVDQLSAEEKQIALLNGTIEAGSRLIEQAGGTTESFADSWARLTVETTNATNALKANAAEIAGPILSNYADFLETTREAGESLLGLGASARFATSMLGLGERVSTASGIAVSLLAGDYLSAFQTATRLGEASIELATKTKHVGTSSQQTGKQVRDFTQDLEAQRRVLQSMGYGAEERLITRIGDAASEAAGGIKHLTDATNDSAAAFGEMGWAIEQNGIAMSNAGSGEILAGWALEAEKAAAAADETAAAFDRIVWSTQQTFSEQIDDAKVKIGELRDKAGELQAKISALEGLRYRTPAQEKELAGLREDLAGVNGDIQEVIDSTDEMVKTFILGMVQMQIAADQEITPAESDFYVRLAEQFGLVDQAAVQMWGVVSGVLTDMATEGLSAEDAIKRIADAADDTIDPLKALAEEGGTALNDLGIDADAARNQIANLGKEGPGAIGAITTAAGGAAGELQRATGQAAGLKAALDLLSDKEIKVTTIFTEQHHGVGTAPAPSQMQAAGGDYFVNQATPFIAGEAGPERAIFIPQGQPGYDADLSALLAPLGRPGEAANASGNAGAVAAMQSYNQSRHVTLINPIFQGTQLASLRALAQMEF